MMRILRALLKVFDDGHYNEADKKEKAAVIESSFLYATIWSLCISINTEFRRPFDMHLKKVCNGDIEG
jgi:hypothetical protein